ncbi:hypothetical protein JCGZ_21762 [Jatropha curcas]|uniref:Uncharacterized protein n=1 Tax=Jatropha curcas TaxID=180498 RepID=A0A067JBU2_JATCU|nr:protein JINGUBANG [Jatropha curcas]KDP21291.1 hypothetical protein JCGZ_21762 [Jatropha curcas]
MELIACPEEKESQSCPDPFRSESFTSSSLSSQPSLPSIPSLTPPSSQQTSTIHHYCLATLRGQSSYVFSLALAGKFLYSGSSNSEITLWSKYPWTHQDSIIKDTVGTSNGAVKSLIIIGDKLFSAHQDCKIRVWKIDNSNKKQNYKCIATLPTIKDRFSRFFSSKNYVKVRRHKKCTWVHHVDTVSALEMSKDGSLLYSASWDRTFKIWRTSDFKCLESIANAHDDAINAIVLSNDEFVYTGSADKKIRVWKKLHAKHSLVSTMEGHMSAVNALAISTDGSVLYSGACDRSIIVWEKDTDSSGGGGGHMVLAGALRGHRKAILCLAVVSDLLCSGSADSTVRIWKRGVGTNDYTCLAVCEGHRRAVKCLSATIVDSDDSNNNSDKEPGGTSYLVYSGSLDLDVRIWKIVLGSNSSIL